MKKDIGKNHDKDSDVELQKQEVSDDSNSKEENTESLDDKLKELEEKVEQLEDLRLRDLAEFENIKKRLEKEKSQAVAYAHEGFARDLLSVIDSLDNAKTTIENIEEADIDKIKEGIDLTLEQFKKIFEKHGISLIDVSGEFDPNFHEAVMKVDSDEHNEGDIVQVLQKGYKIKDRLLRSAMVSIAK